LIIASSCSKDEDEIIPELDLSEFEIDVIDYFKEIALGFEFGNASKIIRKYSYNNKCF
jgi:hypothetical protein